VRGEGERLLRRAVYEVATLAAKRPAVALPLARMRGHGVLLSEGTEVVIEGFPCSGNSFAVAAFAQAQPEAVSIAHHTHAPGHLIAAVRRGLPAVALIREPEDAVPDFVTTRPAVTVGQALRGYARFYGPLLEHRTGLVVAPYQEVVTDLGAVIRRVNERFGTEFREFEHTEENVARARDAAEAYFASRSGPGLPVVGRNLGSAADREASVSHRARSELSSANGSLLLKAQRLFETFTRPPT
jgi:hypothetical protein